MATPHIRLSVLSVLSVKAAANNPGAAERLAVDVTEQVRVDKNLTTVWIIIASSAACRAATGDLCLAVTYRAGLHTLSRADVPVAGFDAISR